jgi:hypothetical protein
MWKRYISDLIFAIIGFVFSMNWVAGLVDDAIRNHLGTDRFREIIKIVQPRFGFKEMTSFELANAAYTRVEEFIALPWAIIGAILGLVLSEIIWIWWLNATAHNRDR